MDGLKKEIESLKRKTFYMSITFLIVSVIYASSMYLQLRRYATIQNYYYESLEDYREVNQMLWELSRILEEVNKPVIQERRTES